MAMRIRINDFVSPYLEVIPQLSWLKKYNDIMHKPLTNPHGGNAKASNKLYESAIVRSLSLTKNS
jgi:hypothetical protein